MQYWIRNFFFFSPLWNCYQRCFNIGRREGGGEEVEQKKKNKIFKIDGLNAIVRNGSWIFHATGIPVSSVQTSNPLHFGRIVSIYMHVCFCTSPFLILLGLKFIFEGFICLRLSKLICISNITLDSLPMLPRLFPSSLQIYQQKSTYNICFI